jgi:hypothetical protein
VPRVCRRQDRHLNQREAASADESPGKCLEGDCIPRRVSRPQPTRPGPSSQKLVGEPPEQQLLDHPLISAEEGNVITQGPKRSRLTLQQQGSPGKKDSERHDRELNKLTREHNKSIRDKVFVGDLKYHFAKYEEIKEC